MSDGRAQEQQQVRLAQLEQRWEATPGSPRVFLQLAEEYRRVGRAADASRVLEAGLQKHPHYPSAQVALGRVRLEMGAAASAAEVLSDVVANDPTHMVAYKLLAEARLRCGDAAGASETLDRYRLLNDGDPESDELARRIAELSPAATPSPAPSQAAPPTAPMVSTEVPSHPATEEAIQAPLHDAVDGAPAMPAPNDGADALLAGAGEPFAALVSGADLGRYLAGLAAGAIFVPPLPPEPVAEAPVAAEAAPASAGLAPDEVVSAAPAATEPALEVPELAEEEPAPPVVAAEAVAAEEALPQEPAAAEVVPSVSPWPEEPAAAVAGEEHDAEVGAPAETAAPVEMATPVASPEPLEAAPAPAEAPAPVAHEAPPSAAEGPPEGEEREATVTLGQLYLDQQHYAEAERIFRAVLGRDPGNAVALLGLTEAERARPRPLTAQQLLRWAAAEAPAAPSPARSPLAALLLAYLARIRHGSRANVP
jgi:tetratricopeptide (TPR) repeat protein